MPSDGTYLDAIRALDRASTALSRVRGSEAAQQHLSAAYEALHAAEYERYRAEHSRVSA